MAKTMHVERGGKTLLGQQYREWRQGMRSNVSGRACEIVRFRKRDTDRVLVRWIDPLSFEWIAKNLMRKICQGQTQWVGLYQIEPEVYVPGVDPQTLEKA